MNFDFIYGAKWRYETDPPRSEKGTAKKNEPRDRAFQDIKANRVKDEAFKKGNNNTGPSSGQ